jgi:hypothetical protein
MAGTWVIRGEPTEPMTTETAAPPCPSCGAKDPVSIVYGYPDRELWQAEERWEVRLGGCVVGPESPEFECRACGVALPWTTGGDPSQR